MPTMQHAGIAFHYRETGQGTPFVFQHGLGGDVEQPFGLFEPPTSFRLLALDSRGHGQTQPLGDPTLLTFTTLADDVIALLDHLELSQVVIGGISMGAGIALNIAVRYPTRIRGLVLSRPAWLDQPMSANVTRYATIADLIRTYGPEDGLSRYVQTEQYQAVADASPDAANSLIGQFRSPRAVDAVARLERIPPDVPVPDRATWAEIDVPVLVLANRLDPIHPFEYGETLARSIPRAEFGELTPKSVSRERHTIDVQHFIAAFLTRHFQ